MVTEIKIEGIRRRKGSERKAKKPVIPNVRKPKVEEEMKMVTSSALEDEATNGSGNAGVGPSADNRSSEVGESETTVVEKFRHQVDDLVSKADELERRVNEVARFFTSKSRPNNSKGSSVLKDKEREKLNSSSNNNNTRVNSGVKKQVDGRRKDGAVCSEKMQEVMSEFDTILQKISQHKWAWPFMHPVDVEGLGLSDYYEVIKKPMDFTTIRNHMEAKYGSGYRNVREIYADVRLVFTNAMTYNEDKSDVHVMAKKLLEKFEEKWLELLPKVMEAETRQKEEEAQALLNMKIAQEAAMEKMARDTNNELNELNSHLEELRELVVRRCRKMSTEEKRKLGVGLSTLSPEDLNKALEIIAQNNPTFQATAEVVDLDMDAQSETTLWRLKNFVKGALELQAKICASKADDISKRKKVIYDDLAKTATKRSKKFAS